MDRVLTFSLERVLRRLALGDVDDAVYIEANLFRAAAPVIVAETVDVLAVCFCVE